MPTYQYRCKDCGSDLEVHQKFTDAALTDCPRCDGGQLRKIYNAVGVHFKGSGFYRTDSRSDSDGTKGSGKPADSSAEKSGKSDSGTAAKSDTGSANSASNGSSSKATTSA